MIFITFLYVTYFEFGAWSTRINPVLTYPLLLPGIATPFFGWIADSWTGRYRLIVLSIVTQLATCVVQNTALILPYPNVTAKLQSIAVVSNFFAFALFQASCLPFTLDQMMGASGDELSAAVDWWVWSQFSQGFLRSLIHCTKQTLAVFYINVFIYTASIAFCLASLLLFKHWLVTEPQITNPIKQVIMVLNYARKNKYPSNRSALTYWEEEFPSRIDLGKDKYGGPFTEEEVENVKTFFRIIPLIFVVALNLLCVLNDLYLYGHMVDIISVPKPQYSCLGEIATKHGFQMILFIGIPLWHLVLKPRVNIKLDWFTMIKQINFGLLLTFIGSLGYLAIEVAGHELTPNANCMFQHHRSSVPIHIGNIWIIIPEFLASLGTVFGSLGIMKLIIAQSPNQVKGLLFGCFFGFNALIDFLGLNVYRIYLFLASTRPSCGFYYYLTGSLISLVVLVLFALLSWFYKLRQINNPVNVHLIVGDHVERYISQREQFLGTRSDSSGSMDD